MTRGPKPKYSDHLALRLEPELRKVLEEIAQEEERTASQMARILLRNAIVAWQKTHHKRTKRNREND